MCSSCGALLPSARITSHVLPPGTALSGGTYVLQQPLGQGAFAVTYEGRDARLARTVAIKEFFPSGCERRGSDVVSGYGWPESDYQNAKERFLREGQALARFRHPGIVDVLLAFEENNTAYLVMEFLKGQTLREVVRERGALPEGDALGYIRHVGAALEVVHGAGLLHRDIKPANIMLTTAGQVVLIDFGAAKEYTAGLTQTHSVVLTPGYAPLEQYALEARRGPFSDVYALAGTLYYLLTAEIPRPATDRLQGLEPRDVREINPAVSERTSAAIRHGMTMEAASRPQTVAAWMEELTPPSVDPQATVTTAVPAPPDRPGYRPAARVATPARRRGGAVLAVVVALVAGLALAFTTHRGQGSDGTSSGSKTVTSSHAGSLESSGLRAAKEQQKQAEEATRKAREEQRAAEADARTSQAGRRGATPAAVAPQGAVDAPQKSSPGSSNSGPSPAGDALPNSPGSADQPTPDASNGNSPEETPAPEGRGPTYRDPAGNFAIRRPPGWTASVRHDGDATRTWFRSPDGRASMMVEVAPGQSSDYPNGTWRWQDAEFRQRYGDSYRRLGITEGTLGGLPSVNWAFGLGHQQKLDVLTYRRGTGCAILCTAPAGDFASLRSVFDRAIESFRFLW